MGHLPQLALLLVPVVKENLELLLMWPTRRLRTSEWGPFSFHLVNKTMLLMLVEIKSPNITDHNC